MLFNRLKRIFQHRELTLLVVAGLLITILLDVFMVSTALKDQDYRDGLAKEKLQAQVQAALEEHVTALIALKVVYQNFTDINRYDFQQYGESITATLNGFQRLFYIDPTLTIRQVYPLSPENSGLYGYSLSNEKPLAEMLKHTRNSQDPTTSRLLPFLKHPKSFWAFIPIYRKNKEFLGFAAGEISLERIWQPYSQSFSQYQIQLIDPAGTPLFEQVNIGPDIKSMPFNVAGQEWQLQLKPVVPGQRNLLLQRGSLWTGSLIIMFLLGMIVLNTRRHKSALEEAQKQFETIFEASPDGLLLLDERLRLQIANPVMRDWVGRDIEDLQDKNFFELFQCQCPNLKKCQELSFLLCTSEQFSQDLPEVLETQILASPPNAPSSLRLNASKIIQERDGRRQEGFICVLGDISTIKELERIKETYVATLTHDLKTPLLAQQMVLESLASGKTGFVSEEQKRLLSGAGQSVRDMLDMVNITLLFYKLETSHFALHCQRKQLTSLAKDVISSLQPLADQKGIKLELDTGLELPDAWVDYLQMKRVFHNLISNAISYGRKGVPIRISIQARGGSDDVFPGQTASGSLLVKIVNEGKGIAPEELPHIFDKYYSLSRKFKQIGTGLGLYISRRIVELHGGRIWAESEPDKTTRFFLSVPCVQQVAQRVVEHPPDKKIGATPI